MLRHCARAARPSGPPCPTRRLSTIARVDRAAMEHKVHRWFESLASDDHAVEEIVSPSVRLTDHINQACYGGHAAIKHRMQSVHESLPRLREVSELVDEAHGRVAAHWVASQGRGEVQGTMTFSFNQDGLISEVVSYVDSSEDEFLEA